MAARLTKQDVPWPALLGSRSWGQVARGRTGVVWQARQVELDRLVAIKELAPELLARPAFVERFRAEARMLAGLDDPHVVGLYDYVEEPGVPGPRMG